MTDDTDKTPEELLKEGGGTRRTATDAPATDTTPALETAITDAYRALDDGAATTHLQCYDRDLAAVIDGLTEADRLADVIEAAAAECDREEPGNISQANALALLARLGLESLDADVVATASEAKREYVLEQSSGF